MNRISLNTNTRNNINGFLFALPWIIGFIFFQLYPLISSSYYSMTEFNAIKSPVWVGFNNYIDLFSDKLFYKSLSNTFFYSFISTPIYIVLGFTLAMLVNEKIIGSAIFRTTFFVPSIIPVVASTMIWIWIYDPTNGLLNKVLGYIGIYQPLWLTDPRFTKWAVIIIGAWNAGTIMVIFLAALQEIPRSYYEASEIDGAGFFAKLFSVTLPSVAHIIIYQVILCLINCFQFFTQPYIIATMTYGGTRPHGSGGPENSLLLYSIYLYQNAFPYLKMGKASAMAWILFIIVAVITILLLRITKNRIDIGTGGE